VHGFHWHRTESRPARLHKSPGAFPEGIFHASLEPICSSTGKHLVDAQDRHERMHSSLKMESIVSYIISHIPVARNACSFKSFTLHIFFVPRNKMCTEGKFINTSLFSCPYITSVIWIRNSSAIP